MGSDENIRKRLLKEIKDGLGAKCILSLIYTDNCELEKKDLRRIDNFTKRIKSKNAVIILHGEGGHSGVGMTLSVLLRKKFNKGFITVIPKKACSAFIYTVLMSSYVILGENSFITPIDPYFYYHGAGYRALYLLYSTNDQLRKRARKHWDEAVHFCWKILDLPGSIVIDPNRINLNKREKITKKLFLPEKHEEQINPSDLKKMGFECDVYEEPLRRRVEHIFESSMIELSEKNGKFLIGNDSKYEICPK